MPGVRHAGGGVDARRHDGADQWQVDRLDGVGILAAVSSKGFATAGIVCGWVGIGGGVLWLAFIVFLLFGGLMVP